MLDELSPDHAEALARGLFESVPGGVVHFRRDGSIAAANAEALRLLDMGSEHLIGRLVIEFENETLREDGSALPPAECPVTRVLLTGASQAAVTGGFRRRDGDTCWVVIRALPIKDETTGELLGAMATFVDITERKRAEEELRRGREFMRKAQELAHVGSWEWDLITGQVRWTEEMYAIHGLDRATFTGSVEQARDCVHPDDRSMVAAYSAQLFSGHGPVTVPHYRIRRPDGTERCVWTSAEIVRDADGHPVKVIGAVQDTTERQQVEMQLRHMQRLESIGQLAGGIAHEFNNLLQPIISSADMILREAPNTNALEIKAAAGRAAELSRQLLAFGRRQPFEPRPLDLNRLIEGFEGLLRLTLGSEIRVVMLLAREVGAVLGDRSQLEQVLMNLAVNARDAMPQGGRLRIETRVLAAGEAASTGQPPTAGSRRRIELVVSDTGLGMSREVLAHAFDPFFTTKEAVSGTGLGLAVVHGIVQTHGGRIMVESHPGTGTTFRIYLPAESEAALLTEDRAEPAAGPGGGETLLVVDDDAAVLRSTARLLRTAKYRVISADSAESALSLYLERAHEIDLVVTDMVMPGQGGVEFVRELRRHRPDTRVLFTTGCAPDKQRGLRDPILDKPYSVDELLTALRSVLDREQPPPSDPPFLNGQGRPL